MQHITRPIDQLWDTASRVVRTLYDRGFRYFLCGGATGFDTLAASCVLQMRSEGKDACLCLAVPCRDQARGWSESDLGLYRLHLQEADHVFLLSSHYYTGCMLVRDRFMVDHAGFCVAYMEEAAGGTAFTIRCAIRRGLPVLNIAIPEEVSLFLTDDSPGEPSLPF